MTRSAIVCDLDGVIWRGHDPIAGAADAVDTLRASGRRVGFVTNNSGRTRADVRTQLAACGITTEDDDVLTSADAAAQLCASALAPGSRVFACAGEGVVQALHAAGLHASRALDAAVDADAVVVGWHNDFDFARLDAAANIARSGRLFVATNMDPTYPAESGRILPGGGAIVAAVATASGITPLVAGKPEQPTVDAVRARFGDAGVMVGDRVSTDGLLAARLGWPFALVFSGVTQPDDDHGGAAIAAADLGALVEWLQTH
ncbi:MAG: HAD-IIA family hydrolase [Acidimicrobiia bacterium]